MGDEELEEVLGRVREEGGAGRESRAAHYDMADPLQVREGRKVARAWR